MFSQFAFFPIFSFFPISSISSITNVFIFPSLFWGRPYISLYKIISTLLLYYLVSYLLFFYSFLHMFSLIFLSTILILFLFFILPFHTLDSLLLSSAFSFTLTMSSLPFFLRLPFLNLPLFTLTPKDTTNK